MLYVRTDMLLFCVPSLQKKTIEVEESVEALNRAEKIIWIWSIVLTFSKLLCNACML